MNNNNIDWEGIVAAFSSYEGSLKDFCTIHEITKGQLYYYRKKFKKQDHINFHAISMSEEKSKSKLI